MFNFKDAYMGTVRGHTSVWKQERSDNFVYIISLPFLDPDYDHLEVYAEKIDDDSWHIHDDGNTLSALFMHGISTRSRRIRAIIKSICSNYKLDLKIDDSIGGFVKNSPFAVGDFLNKLITCLIQVLGLIFYEASQNDEE